MCPDITRCPDYAIKGIEGVLIIQLLFVCPDLHKMLRCPGIQLKCPDITGVLIMQLKVY